MARARYQPKPEEPKLTTYDTRLPTHLPVAAYYRQSTIAQVGNQSTGIQTVDMVEYLKRLGWAAENILLIDMDAGVSGTTKIDEREGMSELFRLITTGKVGAVCCQDEDRLFRDVTQIQVNIFIQACKEHRVLVVTPSMSYDFSHEQMGAYYARQFRFKSEMAAEYITAYIRGKLQPAKRRILMTGRWAGQLMLPGYMIDTREALPSGAPNPNHRKYVIFEPYAEVVRAYWQLFLHFGGQLRPTARHILAHGPYYPAPDTCKPPEGFRVVYRLCQHKGKWCPSRSGLRDMLTNAVFAGHWMMNGRIVIWNNHPAIITPDVFMRAFNYLSEVGLDGEPNAHYAPIQVNARPSKAEERNEDWPLCAGLLFSQDTDGEWVRVGTRWRKARAHYDYELWSKQQDVPVVVKKAAFVDEAVSNKLLDKLDATFDFDAWEETVAGLADRFAQEKSLRESQLKKLQAVMENLVANLGALQHPQMIRAAEKQYADAEVEAERLRRELAEQEAETLQVEQVRELRESCGEIFRNWPNMSHDEQRQILHTFIRRIEATPASGNGLDLLIRWKDGSTSAVSLPGRAGPHVAWTEAEKKRVIALMESDANQLEIAKVFPNRTWWAIYLVYKKAVKSLKAENRRNPRRKLLILRGETYNEYMARTKGKSLTDSTSDNCSRFSNRSRKEHR